MTDDSEKRKEEEEEEGKKPKFRVVDRRRINPDEVEASDKPPETVETPPEPVVTQPSDDTEGNEIPTPFFVEPSPDDKDEKGEKELPEFKMAPGVGEEQKPSQLKPEEDPLHFRNIAISLLQTIATVALVDLGLVPHPQTNLIAKKLEDARKAIDLFEVVLVKVGGDLPEELRSEFDRALQDLKANYVGQL